MHKLLPCLAARTNGECGRRMEGGVGVRGGEVSPSCGGAAGRTFTPCLHRGASLSDSLWLDLFGY